MFLMSQLIMAVISKVSSDMVMMIKVIMVFSNIEMESNKSKLSSLLRIPIMTRTFMKLKNSLIDREICMTTKSLLSLWVRISMSRK